MSVLDLENVADQRVAGETGDEIVLCLLECLGVSIAIAEFMDEILMQGHLVLLVDLVK